MTFLSAVAVGLLCGAALYLMLQQHWIDMVFGFALLTHAGSLFVLTLSGTPLHKLPPVKLNLSPIAYVDPLPQALILTAIVIGFGISAFMIVMVYRLLTHKPTEDADDVD